MCTVTVVLQCKGIFGRQYDTIGVMVEGEDKSPKEISPLVPAADLGLADVFEPPGIADKRSLILQQWQSLPGLEDTLPHACTVLSRHRAVLLRLSIHRCLFFSLILGLVVLACPFACVGATTSAGVRRLRMLLLGSAAWRAAFAVEHIDKRRQLSGL